MFEKNTEINADIDAFVKKLVFNSYTYEVWDVEYLNNCDRNELAREFASEFFDDKRLREQGYDAIGGKSHYNEFIKYVALKIDRLIPRIYFMEANKEFSEQYNSLLTKRIFTTYGKDEFEATAGLVYKYPQDFSEEEGYIQETAASDKQIEYLDTLAGQQGFQLVNSEYLSKINANALIEYFKGTTEIEPIVFTYFIIAI